MQQEAAAAKIVHFHTGKGVESINPFRNVTAHVIQTERIGPQAFYSDSAEMRIVKVREPGDSICVVAASESETIRAIFQSGPSSTGGNLPFLGRG